MSEPIDLTTVIEDSLTDAVLPDEPETTDPIAEPTEEPSAELLEASESDVQPVEDTTPSSLAVASPAAKQAPADSPIDKKIGIPSHTNGRENRIPYTRVKKIVENAEKPHLARIAELEPQVKELTEMRTRVQEFEHVVVNEPQRLLGMLATLPAYKTFFDSIQDLQSRVQAQATQQEQVVDNDPMPQPDDEASGTYTMQGLKNLLDWQARQVKSQVTRELSTQYDPIKKDWEAQQHLNKIIPQIDAKIKEARTWPMFQESENEIIQFLNKNPQAQLEDAYRVVVFPKLKTDKEEVRRQVLSELQKAKPAPTSVNVRPTRTTQSSASSGPKSLEDVIREQIKGIK
jgi:hypothetical protein